MYNLNFTKTCMLEAFLLKLEALNFSLNIRCDIILRSTWYLKIINVDNFEHVLFKFVLLTKFVNVAFVVS